ncbi:MAG: hypothetical protein EOP08_09820, partial [Proteobacteria bacterium]
MGWTQPRAADPSRPRRHRVRARVPAHAAQGRSGRAHRRIPSGRRRRAPARRRERALRHHPAAVRVDRRSARARLGSPHARAAARRLAGLDHRSAGRL